MLVAGVAVTAGAEVAIGPLAVGRTAAMGLDAAPAADDVLGLQADSASPTPRPSAEMLAPLVLREKWRGGNRRPRR
jgi:hypothetical protein